MFDKLVRKREVHTLLYPYAEFPGELSVTYSQIIKDPTVKNGEKIFVHFEKPTDYGFKEARYTLPDFKEVYNYDFTPTETKEILEILENEINIDYIILNNKLPGEIKLNNLIKVIEEYLDE